MALSIFIITMGFLLAFLLVFSQILCAQKTEQVFEAKGDLGCNYKKVYSSVERQKFYPFSDFDIIKIVSFRHHIKEIPVRKDSVVVDSILEEKYLTKNDAGDLTDILYNNFYKSRPNYGVMNQCYIPRNAILFYNKLGKLVESIILCFHCYNYKVSSEEINMGDNCTEKMDKLRKFFILKDILFGTDPEILSYPGETFRSD